MTRGVLGVALASATVATACDRLLQLTTVTNPTPADAVHADASPGRICFSDDFNSLASSQWGYFNGSATMVSRNGAQLVVDVPSGASNDYAGANIGPASLVGMSSVVQAVKVSDVPGVTSELNWGVNGGSDDYALYEQTEQLIVAVHQNGVYELISGA